MTEVELVTGSGNMEKVNIILADDHPLLRQALRGVIEKETDFKIVAEAGDGEETIKLVEKLVPDVVIMDISMPKLNGIEATRRIKSVNPNIDVLVLTVHDDTEHILGILEAGAAGYLTKSVFGNEVIHAIRSVIAGESVLSREVFNQVMRHALRHTIKPVPLGAGEKLTQREIEILKLVSQGIGNKDIAEKLDLSLHSIKSYVAEIFTKLGVASRTEAVITGLRIGIITLKDIE